MVYEVRLDQTAEASEEGVGYRKVRGEADNLLAAAHKAEKLLKKGESITTVKPLWNLDW